MAINFPSSPSLNQVFNDTNTGNLYIWTGDVWLGYGNALPIQVGGGESYWISTAAGIHTLSNVGIGTTNPISALTVQGDGRFSGVVTATSFSGTNLNLSGTATVDDISLGSGAAFIDYNAFNVVFTIPTGVDDSSDYGGFKFITTNPGLPPSQETSLSLYSAGGYWDRLVRVHRSLQVDNNIAVNGTSAFAGITTVTGNTLFTKQLSVSGVSTLSSNVSVGGTISIDGGVKLATNNATIVGTSGTVGEIKQIGGAPFFYDGSAWREFVLSSGTPVTVPADTEWDNVVFRATFDDNFTDAKFGATPVRVSAGATIVGSPVKIGTGAYRNDGVVGSGVSYAYRSDYDFTGSWTIEFWMYVDSNPAYSNPLSPLSLVSMHSTTGIGTSGNWTLAMYEDLYANKYISWFNQNSTSYRGGASLYYESGAAWNSTILDKWNHFAIVREGDNGSIHFYVNGIERAQTISDNIIDNDILDINGSGLHFGGDTTFTIGALTFNSNASADVIFDDVRISCGVGTAGQRYTSVGSATTVFTPPTTALPTTGTLSSYVQPPGDKYGEITLGGSPTWRGTSGVTVSQQSSGNYRVSFASSYTNANDYYVLSQGMDQGFASYVGIARSTTHVDLSINKQSDDTAVNTGALAVQIKNHI